MLIQFQDYLTLENIYLWTNFGVLPFWFLLVIIPNSKITQLFVNSIILPLILAITYVYVFYLAILLDEPIFDVLKLYLSLDNLYTIFATENFLLAFWIHFLKAGQNFGSYLFGDEVFWDINQISKNNTQY